MIEIYQGQTLYIEITIVDLDGNLVLLPDTDAVFAYKRGSTTVEVPGTIVSSIFRAKLEPEDTTLLLGKYDVEIKVKDNTNDDIGVVLHDDMVVSKSVIPVYGIS